MRISVSIDLSGFDAYEKRMREGLVVSNSGPYQDAMVEASNIYHESMRERFLEASNRDGTWAPLAPSTSDAHKRIGDDPYHILHFWGDLEKSLYRDDPFHVVEVLFFSVVEGSNDYKAAWHQEGTGRMPARPIYVPADSETLDEMKSKIAEGLQNLISS